MKRIEIIIPHRKLEDAHEIIKDANTGDMSYYTVEGSGRIKAERITVGRGTAQTRPRYIPRTKIELIVQNHNVEGLLSKMDGFIRQVQGLAGSGQITQSNALQLMNSAQAIQNALGC